MAVVKITVSDNQDGTVKFESDPSFEKMMKMHISGNQLTGAHGIAIAAMNAMLREKRGFKKKSPLITPTIY